MRTLGEGSALRSAVLGETGDRLARRNRALDMRYAGIAFRDHEERKTAPLLPDLAADLYEAFSFAFLAVGAGIDHLVADIEKLEPPKPDLIVKLTDGSSVYVEVGRDPRRGVRASFGRDRRPKQRSVSRRCWRRRIEAAPLAAAYFLRDGGRSVQE